VLLLLLLQVDTKDILFVVGGAFIDLERQLMDSRHKSSIGFGNKVCYAAAVLLLCVLLYVRHEDR
jgi:ATP-dependent protease Clp ATPase subunit